MLKLSKLLNKYNKQYLYKEKTNVWQFRRYEKELSRQDLFFKIKNDEDFIRFEVIRTSYDNMREIQNKFFDLKAEFGEVWDVISYQEKHFLLYQKLAPFMDSLKHFIYQDKRYFVAFFDDLINAYYDHDMLMFENDAYRKYLYDFNKIVIDPSKFGILPVKSGFSQVDFIVGDDDNYVLYSSLVNRFYKDNNAGISFGISKPLNEEQVHTIASFIYNNEKEALVDYLIFTQLGSKRLLKRLKRVKGKLIK